MNKSSTLFWLRKNQASNGKAPIMCRIRINGERAPDFSTGKFIEYVMLGDEMIFKRWERIAYNKKGEKIYTNDQKVLGSKDDAILINDHLDGLRNRVSEVVRNLEKNGELVTAERVQSIVVGKEKTTHALLELYQEEINRKKALVPAEFTKVTITRCQAGLNMLKLFVKDTYKSPDISITEVTHQFVAKFEHWGKTIEFEHETKGVSGSSRTIKKPKWTHNYSTRSLVNLKSITDLAIANGYLKIDPFAKRELSYNKSKFKYLTDSEKLLLESTEIPDYKLNRVRDVFVFCCYTGFAFVDVKRLTTDYLAKNIDGSMSITKDRQKSDVGAFVPLLDKPRRIIEKYRDDEVCLLTRSLLPVPYYKSYNDDIKAVANLCGIKRHLTTHIARHTCATFLLNNKIEPVEVARILGVSLKVLLQTYGTILTQTVTNSMNALQERLNKAV